MNETSGVLIAHGRLSWDQLRNLGADLQCFWTDYDGVHLAEPLPQELPPTTHVWAWRSTGCLIARTDLDEVIVGELLLGPAAVPAETQGGENVAIEVRPLEAWGAEDRIGFRPTQAQRLILPTLEVVQVGGNHPCTFIRSRPS